jgi:hypothetical protein
VKSYNLVTNSNIERPTVADHQGAFKKLVGNSEYWYDRTKKGELEPRPKEQDKDKVRKSCPVCGMPMFERALDSDPTKTIEACAT